MKRLFAILMIAFVFIGFCFAGGEAEGGAAASAESAAPAESHIPQGEPPAGVIELVMWDDVNSLAHGTLEAAAAKFNEIQSQYHVTVIYTSNILTKMLTSSLDDRPNIFQTTGNQSSTYIVPKIDSRFDDLNLYVPLQEFIDHDGYDVNKIVKNSFSICVRGGKWQMFPLGNTDTGLYVNYDMLATVGMKPEDLKSMQDVYEACRRLKEQTGKGEMFFWYRHVDPMNYAIAAEGVQLFNNNNGRDGVPDKFLFDEGEAKDVLMSWFEFLVKMRDEGLLCDPGIGSSDARLMFAAGELLFFPQTLSSYATIEGRDPTFNWGFIPSPTVRAGKENLGQSPGGRFVFVSDVDDPWKEYGSWLFVKYLMEDEWAAQFAQNVGYTPTTVAAKDWDTYSTYLSTHPDLVKVIEAQNTTKDGLTMPLLPYQTDYSSSYANLLKKMLISEPTMTAQQAYDEMCAFTKENIEMYFLSAGIVL